MSASRVLFVTWDAPESSYLAGLFLPIFEALRRRDSVQTLILQITWADGRERSRARDACEKGFFEYSEVLVHRRIIPLGAVLGVFQAACKIRQILRQNDVNVILARSTLPAMAALLARRGRPDIKFVFDADGLPHDERVEFGDWSADGLQYRLLRDLESLAVRRADSVLVRSSAAVDMLMARGGPTLVRSKFYRVNNARDELRFVPATLDTRRSVRRDLDVGCDAPLVCFVGSSMVGKYCGLEMFQFFKAVQNRRQDAKFAIFTEKPEEAAQLLTHFPELSQHCRIRFVEPHDVPAYVGACDLGLALIKPGYSMQAASAIKLGEYLLCGIPVLATAGIGDAEEVLTQGVGYSLGGIDEAELHRAADWFLLEVLDRQAEFANRCREVGVAHYALESAANTYIAALNSVGDRVVD